MNERNARYNILTRGQILPPPIPYDLNNNISRQAKSKVLEKPLLHLAYASCGRVVLCLCLLLMNVACSSGADDYEPMPQPTEDADAARTDSLDSVEGDSLVTVTVHVLVNDEWETTMTPFDD